MSSRWIVGLSRVHPGDPIEVWEGRQLRCTGTVSQVAPHLGVLWIVEASTGLPKLIEARSVRLRHAPAVRAA